MRRWQAFNALCDCLRAGLLGGRPPRLDRIGWELPVEFSSHHYVIPALAWCAHDRPDLPDTVRAYFGSILTLNRLRNEALLNSLERVVGALNAAGIEPMLLKGAAHLVDGLYPSPGLRLMGDLDILVAQDRAENAVTALRAIGFAAVNEGLPASHHHLPRMQDGAVCVEVHTRIEHREDAVPAPWFCEQARTASFRGLAVRLPEPTRSVGHNVVHGQLNHAHYQRGTVELRQLLDLAMIRARDESRIDWGLLDRRFGAAGLGHVLATYLNFAEVFFGQPTPPLAHAPRPNAVADLRLGVDPVAMNHREADTILYAFNGAEARWDGGNCWMLDIPANIFHGDTGTEPTCSMLELFEDGRPLGPPHYPHALIRTQGAGAFSHWHRTLYFSTSDNSDPHVTRRQYLVKAPGRKSSARESAARA
jgi:hypothetical protein